MLHTEYKLSNVSTDKNELENAGRIVAKYCLEGALENQENNGLSKTYEALKNWGFRDIIDCYLGVNLVLKYWFGYGDEVRIKEPATGTWHDELLIDIKDFEAYELVLSVACIKIEAYAKNLEADK